MESVRLINIMRRKMVYKESLNSAKVLVFQRDKDEKIVYDVFYAWKHQYDLYKQQVATERKRVLMINNHMDLYKKDLFFRELVAYKNRKQKHRRDCLIADHFRNFKLAQYAMNEFNKYLDLVCQENEEVNRKWLYYENYYAERIMKKVFDQFRINSIERIEQKKLEFEALEMRQKKIRTDVLKHWIKVGNYWLDKSFNKAQKVTTIHQYDLGSTKYESPVRINRNTVENTQLELTFK